MLHMSASVCFCHQACVNVAVSACVCVPVCVVSVCVAGGGDDITQPSGVHQDGVVFAFCISSRTLGSRSRPAKATQALFLLSQVEAVIHPRFLEALLSPEASMDSWALSQELEQEEGLTLDQVNQEREGHPEQARGQEHSGTPGGEGHSGKAGEGGTAR